MSAIEDIESAHSSDGSLPKRLSKHWKIVVGVAVGLVLFSAGCFKLLYSTHGEINHPKDQSTPEPIILSHQNQQNITDFVEFPSKNTEREVFLEHIKFDKIGSAIDRVIKFRNSTKATAIDEDKDLKDFKEKEAMKFAIDHEESIKLMEKYLKEDSKVPITEKQYKELTDGIRNIFPNIQEEEFNQLMVKINAIPKLPTQLPPELSPEVTKLASKNFTSTDQINVLLADSKDIQMIRSVCDTKRAEIDKIPTLTQLCDVINKIEKVVNIGKQEFTNSAPDLEHLETILALQNDPKCMAFCNAQSVTTLLDTKFTNKIDPAPLIKNYDDAKAKAIEEPNNRDELDKSAQKILDVLKYLKMPSSENRFTATHDTPSKIIINDLKRTIDVLSRQSMDVTLTTGVRGQHDKDARKQFELLSLYDTSIAKNYEDYVKVLKFEIEYKDAVIALVNILKSKIDNNTWVTNDVRLENQNVLADINKKLQDVLIICPQFADTDNDLVNTTTSPQVPKSTEDIFKTLVEKFIVPHLLTKLNSDETKQLCGVIAGSALIPDAGTCDAIAKLIPQIKTALGDNAANIPGGNGRLQKIDDGAKLTLYLKILGYKDILLKDYAGADKLDLADVNIGALLDRINGLDMTVLNQVEPIDDQVPNTTNLLLIRNNIIPIIQVYNILTAGAAGLRTLNETKKIIEVRNCCSALVQDHPLAAYMSRRFEADLMPSLKSCIKYCDEIITDPKADVHVDDDLHVKLKDLKKPAHNVIIRDQAVINMDADLKCLDGLIVNDVASASNTTLFIHFAQKCRLFRLPNTSLFIEQIKGPKIYEAIRHNDNRFPDVPMNDPRLDIIGFRKIVKDQISEIKTSIRTSDPSITPPSFTEATMANGINILERVNLIHEALDNLLYDYDPSILELHQNYSVVDIKRALLPYLLTETLNRLAGYGGNMTHAFAWWRQIVQTIFPNEEYMNSLPQVIRESLLDQPHFEFMVSHPKEGIVAKRAAFMPELEHLFDQSKGVLLSVDEDVDLNPFFSKVNDVLAKFKIFGGLPEPFDGIESATTVHQMMHILAEGRCYLLNKDGGDVGLLVDDINDHIIQDASVSLFNISEKIRAKIDPRIDPYKPFLENAQAVFTEQVTNGLFEHLKDDLLAGFDAPFLDSLLLKLKKLAKFPRFLHLHPDLFRRINKIIELELDMKQILIDAPLIENVLPGGTFNINFRGDAISLILDPWQQSKANQSCDNVELISFLKHEPFKLAERYFSNLDNFKQSDLVQFSAAIIPPNPIDYFRRTADRKFDPNGYTPANANQRVIYQHFKIFADMLALDITDNSVYDKAIRDLLAKRYSNSTYCVELRHILKLKMDPAYTLYNRFTKDDFESFRLATNITSLSVTIMPLLNKSLFQAPTEVASSQGVIALRNYLATKIINLDVLNKTLGSYLTYLLSYIDFHEQRKAVIELARSINASLILPQELPLNPYPSKDGSGFHLWNATKGAISSGFSTFSSILNIRASEPFSHLWNRLESDLTLDTFEKIIDASVVFQKASDVQKKKFWIEYQYLLNLSVRMELILNNYKLADKSGVEEHNFRKLHCILSLGVAARVQGVSLSESLKNSLAIPDVQCFLDGKYLKSQPVKEFIVEAATFLNGSRELKDLFTPLISRLEYHLEKMKQIDKPETSRFTSPFQSKNDMTVFVENMHNGLALDNAVNSVNKNLRDHFFVEFLPAIIKYVKQLDTNGNQLAITQKLESYLQICMGDLPIPSMLNSEIINLRNAPTYIEQLKLRVKAKLALEDFNIPNVIPDKNLLELRHLYEMIQITTKDVEEFRRWMYTAKLFNNINRKTDLWYKEFLQDIAQCQYLEKLFDEEGIELLLPSAVVLPGQFQTLNWPLDLSSTQFAAGRILRDKFIRVPLIESNPRFHHYLAKQIDAPWDPVVKSKVNNALNIYTNDILLNLIGFKDWYYQQIYDCMIE